MNKALRLLGVIRCLQSRWYETSELAERFDVSQRTIQRDLLDLSGDPEYCPLIQRRSTLWRMIVKTTESDV